jgi:hypothetical protein
MCYAASMRWASHRNAIGPLLDSCLMERFGRVRSVAEESGDIGE